MAIIIIPKAYVRFETSLAAKMSPSASSFTLATSTDPDGTTLSGTYRLTFDEGTSLEEDMIVTLAGASGTVVTRGLSRVNGVTNVAGNQFQHDLGASVKITNQALVSLLRLLNGDDTFNAVNWLGVNSISGLATPTSGETTKAANVAYCNALAIAGAPDAATNVKGIVEIATSAEASAGTSTGSTGAVLVIPASLCNATSSATTLIPVTNSSGKISTGFMDLGSAWNFTSTLDISTASNWSLASTAFTGTMALLNEACTFFNATGITGAEAETLTDGSNADSLHTHAGFLGLNTAGTTYTYSIPITTWTNADGAYNVLYPGHFESSGATWASRRNLMNFNSDTQLSLEFDSNKDTTIEFRAIALNGVTGDRFWGLGAGEGAFTGAYNLTGESRIGFSMDGGTLYATTSNGSAQTNSTAIVATITQWHTYKIVWNPGTDVKFYVDGVLSATITTTIPTGASAVQFGIGGETSGEDTAIEGIICTQEL